MPLLARSLVTAPAGAAPSGPSKWLLFLHGLLGRGANLRTIARQVVAARPAWGAVLVDLRMHGGSQGFAPPHTVAAAADDLLALEGALPGPVRGVLGHSLGGKVALEYLRRRSAALEHVFTVDSSPSPRAPEVKDSPTRDVIRHLAALPPLLPSRHALVERMAAAGLGRGFGQWLSMNLEPRAGGWALAVRLDAIEALLDDYFRSDLWPLVEALPGAALLHAVIGARSAVYTTDDRDRLARAAASQPGRIDVRLLPAGHWVHVEDPDGLVGVVVEALAPWA